MAYDDFDHDYEDAITHEEHTRFDATISPELRPDNWGLMVYEKEPHPNGYGVKLIMSEYFKHGAKSETGWQWFECNCSDFFWRRNVEHSKVPNCGCRPSPNRLNLLGKTFNKLTVTQYRKGAGWGCRCECGEIRWANTNQLMTGAVKSCGQCRLPRQILSSAQLPEKLLQDARRIKISTGDRLTTIIERLFYAGLEKIPEYNKAFLSEGLYLDDRG